LTDLLDPRHDHPHYLPEIMKRPLDCGNALANRANAPVTVVTNAVQRLRGDGRANEEDGRIL
jgi:hypothetical protein